MNRCPLTYEPCEGRYSPQGLKRLSRRLTDLQSLPFTAEGLRREAAARATKMSIQGVQPKLSARLAVAQQRFEFVDTGGRYILKPPTADYPEVPENEDLTMRLAAQAGLEVPLHGLLYGQDGALTYFVRRFDRVGRTAKVHVEDFAQLSGHTRATKYGASMEQVAGVVKTLCTFPAVECVKLFRLTLFSFLVGNEDLHLKNFSLIHQGEVVTISPAYDLLNTTIALARPEEELALPLFGKKNRLKREDLVEYFGGQRLGLPGRVVARVLEQFRGAISGWQQTIEHSFLSRPMQDAYLRVLRDRVQRILP